MVQEHAPHFFPSSPEISTYSFLKCLSGNSPNRSNQIYICTLTCPQTLQFALQIVLQLALFTLVACFDISSFGSAVFILNNDSVLFWVVYIPLYISVSTCWTLGFVSFLLWQTMRQLISSCPWMKYVCRMNSEQLCEKLVYFCREKLYHLNLVISCMWEWFSIHNLAA